MLAEHGVAITTRFYQNLFREHPELLNVFNHAHQREGRQQAALAGAVYAAAKHIDDLGAVLPVVKQIAHKHRSLGILPEHYPVVGKNLLRAIKEILGDAATDEILQAWTEAYAVIADAFIAVEREMYTQAETQPGGWAGFRPFVIARKQPESDTITSFYLRPADGGPIATFEPGQYITLKLSIPGDPYTHLRQYSLSSAPHDPMYRISVKREDARPDQEGTISTYLHRKLKEGDTVLVSAPAGDFVLDRTSDRPVVLLSAGVGLTPMVSMLNALVHDHPERRVTFIHATTSGQTHAMAEHLTEVASAHPQVRSFLIYSRPTDADRTRGHFHKEGRIDLDWLTSVLPEEHADVYLCGPAPFLKDVRNALLVHGVPPGHIHYEYFGPAADIDAAPAS
ncbi:Flavohemoprotein (Hemoglobin-like protein) [Chondromyces apiculatus DSM 436]|uniref:Flavohemoprotein n=1 Tax=Chondromyces apiculatus DSM 436 TaxID=1192034 RepID=A0A017T2A5_9BACT|nr:Flavohemoprotein (Hemoglobin-like protein) [Chondromyces apiculatus DSM 436]